MSFLSQAPLDTSAYMIAGYAVFFIVIAFYLASLLIRWRKLKLDLEALKEEPLYQTPGNRR